MKTTFDDIRIAYIGGGSRGWAWSLMGDLALDQSISGEVRLYDIDYESAVANERIGNSVSEHPKTLGKWRYRATRTLEETLTGADVVVISILPGSFEEMEADVHIPERFGIYQSVGDTTGPAGILRSLRSIPIFIDLAQRIKQFAPKAGVINYTNPMTLVTKALYEGFPGVRAIGCCHEVLGMKKNLAAMVEKEEKVHIPFEDIQATTIGINHLTWFSEASYKGNDLFPFFDLYAKRYAQEGIELLDEDEDPIFGSRHRVQFDLFNKFQLIPSAGDRHLAEFFPPSWFLRNPESVASWGFALTPVSWRKQHRQQLMQRSKKLLSGEETMDFVPSGEEVTVIIKALIGVQNLVINGNVPNRGQIDNLPLGNVVETNVMVNSDSIRPVFAGSLPPAIHSVISRHVDTQELVLRAAVEKNVDLVHAAFLNDPLTSELGSDQAKDLVMTMLRATKTYLPGWDL